MKTNLYFFLTILCVTPISVAEIESELKVDYKATDDETSTMHYAESVTYSLEGFTPLKIEVDYEKGIYPAGVSEIHKLGAARFLTIGEYSVGGGTDTTVITIFAGKEGRLTIQDKLEFARDRMIHADKVAKQGDAAAIAFPAIPVSVDVTRQFHNWEIEWRGLRYDVDAIRKFQMTKPDGQENKMIVFRIDENGFVSPASMVPPATE